MNKREYYTTLANYFAAQPLFFDGELQKKPHVRKCMEQPFQQTKGEMWDEVTETLCDLNFIQAKACAKQTYDLVKDYYFALDGLPEYQLEKEKERKRQERIDKYTQDLIACAKGEITIDELEIPESITPWTQEQIEAEIERIKIYPKRADKLIDFIGFMGQEVTNLHNNASEIKSLTIQQAWNFSNDGPVAKIVNNYLNFREELLLSINEERPVWNPKSIILKKLIGHRDWVQSGSISTNEKFAITCSWDTTIKLWDILTGQLIKSLNGHSHFVNSVCISPDGKIAASGSEDKKIILWDLESGTPINILEGHNSTIKIICMTPNCQYLLSSSGSSLKLWSFADCELLNVVEFYSPEKSVIGGAHISNTGHRAISYSYNEITQWDLITQKIIWNIRVHSKAIKRIDISANWRYLISCSEDNSVIILEIKTGQILKSLFYENVQTVCFTADAKHFYIGVHYYTLHHWDILKWRHLRTINLDEYGFSLDKLSLSADGHFALSCSFIEKEVTILNLEATPLSKLVQTKRKSIDILSLFPDEQKLIFTFRISRKEAVIGIYDLKKRKTIVTFNKHKEQITGVCILPDGDKFISSSKDTRLILWDLHKNDFKILEVGGYKIASICVTPCGRFVIVYDYKSIVIWDIENEQKVNKTVAKGFNFNVDIMDITPDGSALIYLGSKSIIVFDLKSPNKIKSIGDCHLAQSLKITPDGRFVIVGGSRNNEITIWDLRSNQLIKRMSGHEGWVKCLEVTKNGKYILSGSIDKSLKLWDISEGSLISHLQTKASTNSISISDRVIVGDTVGISQYEIDQSLLFNDSVIATITSIWNFKLKQYQSPSARCPHCRSRFLPPSSIISTIKKIAKQAGLKPEQSPCLELPDEAWEQPGLLSNCPKCGQSIKFNPFIAGGEF